MKLFVRILLAADIILALIAGPLIVAGGGFGAGVGGSSFAQKTNLAKSVDQQKLALILVQAICEESDGSPKTTDKIKELAQTNDKAAWCEKPRGDGIAIKGGAQSELAKLFNDEWDVRVLYAISYLYQKRFSATSGGYNMICKDSQGDAKPAPSMTIAIHTASDGTPYSKLDNRNLPPEDDKEAKTDFALSAHARGQAFDVLTYGCTTIKVEGKVKSIIPSQISTASMSESDALKAMADAIGKSPEELKADLAVGGASSAVLATKAAVEATNSTVTTAAGLAAKKTLAQTVVSSTKTAEAYKRSGYPSVVDTNQPGPSSDTEATIAGALAHGQSGFEPGIYNEGAKPEKVGIKTLEEKLSASFDDPIKIAESLGASAEASNISPQAYAALKAKNYAEAARLEGARRINDDLQLGLDASGVATLSRANTASAVLLGQSILLQRLPVERAKTALALVQGGYQAVSDQLDEVDAARKSDKSIQLAQALYETGTLAASEITTIRDFVNGDQVARDGATRRFEQSGASSEILSWMKANQNLSAEEQKAAQTILTQGTKTADFRANLKNTITSVKGLAIEEFYAQLDPIEKQAFSKILGKTSLTAEDLQQAAKDGQLQRALEAASLAKQLQASGLSDSDSIYVASGVFSKNSNLRNSALGFFNNKNGTNFALADFKSTTTPGGTQIPPKAAVYYAQNLLAQETGLSVSQVQSAIEKKDATVLGQIAQKFAPKLKLPASLIQSVLKSDSPAKAQEGVKLQDKKIAGAIKGDEKEKKDFQDKLDEQMDKAINKGEEMARGKAAELLASKGLSAEDAKTLANGNFKNAQNFMMAAAISREGVLTYDQAKNLFDNPTLSEKYQASDSILNYAFAQQGINVQVSPGFTQTMISGPADQREQQMIEVGAGYYAPELVKFASSQNIVLSNEQAQQILQNHDWETLRTTGESATIATASERISQETGIPSEAISTIANNLQASGGDLGKIDIESAGWDIGESLTGVSKDAVLNIEDNFAAVKDNMIAKYENMPGQMLDMAGNIGAGIIVSTLVGGQLAKIDPTGGMLTSYAMSYATQYLMTVGIGAPYLIAAALIINPEATIAAIKGMVEKGLQLFYDPAGFVMGILGQMGFGSSKPFTGGVFGNYDAATKDVLTAKLIESTAAGAALAQEASKTETEQTKKDDSQADQAQTSSQEGATGETLAATANLATGQTGSAATSAQNKTYSLSPYLLSQEKPSTKYLQAVAKRSIDQAIEDLTVFSIVTAPKYSKEKDAIANHWTAFMKDNEMKPINLPSFAMSAKQILSPQIITLASYAPSACKVDQNKIDEKKKTGIQILYENEESSAKGLSSNPANLPGLIGLGSILGEAKTGSDKPPLGIDGLTAFTQLVYGDNFYPICSYGRTQGLLYDEMVKAVHFGV